MGAPKQKWTQEEESALRSGVVRHGAGKWRTILKDPEFNRVLHLRSNVDLKDKWRNMSLIANGWGSREKYRVAAKRTHAVPKQEDNSLANSTSLQSDEEMEDDQQLYTTGSSALQVSTTRAPKRPNFSRLEVLIMEAIATLKEPGGSYKTTIAAYIEEEYKVPQDFKPSLSTKLKYLTASGKLMKVQSKYRIPNSTSSSSHKKRNIRTSSGKQSNDSLPSPKTDGDEVSVQTRSQIEIDLARMKSMDVHEAAAVAAQAVAEAETAMAEAEEAAKEAEAAEAEAEAAQAFAEEALKTLKERNNCNVMIHA